jgi:integrase
VARAAGSNRTIAQLWEDRRKELGNKRMALNMKYSGLPIINFFGHLEPRHVNKNLCDEYIRLRESQGKKPWTIHTELSHLRSTLNWAKRGGSIPRLSAPPPKDLFLTKSQAKGLLNACEQPHLRIYILLALSTGARNGALLDLSWDRVDLSRRLIELRTEDMANKKGRATVPINNGLYELLKAVEHPSGFVVQWGGRKVASVKKALKRLATKVGLPWLSPHVFRHSAAVWMAESGVPMDEIAQFLGHSNVEITRKVYAKYSPDYLRNAAKALELTEHKDDDDDNL